jgi:hypothetical protein
MTKKIFATLCCLFLASQTGTAQDKAVLIPKAVANSPFQVDDSEDVFGQAYRWLLEGESATGAEKIKSLITKAGFQMKQDAYYVVVANFTDSFSPIGMFYNSSDFMSTRMYGLKADNLYFIFITRQQDPQTYISVLATSKASPFEENLLPFLSLFIPIIPSSRGVEMEAAGMQTRIDVRQFEIPPTFRKNCDLSFLVKKDLSEEKDLARAVFDNTSRERWSYGIATAITSVDDVDIIVGSDGTIIVNPKPNLDLATFAVVDYHFKPIDTKAKSFGNSFHAMTGIRLVDFIEPIIGVGAGFDLGAFDLALFAGMSVEFANKLDAGYSIGQKVGSEVDPFKLKVRGKPRFGIQVKFP